MLEMSEDESFSPTALLDGFRKEGGWINRDVFGLKRFESMGYGAVALKDIPENAPLFRIPNDLLLTPYSSDLSDVLSESEIDSLGTGWTRLILVMMWEESKGQSSKWSSYLRNLPRRFDTPMFWTEEDLSELQGTDIERRIGKEQAEKDYNEKIIPILRAHPNFFPTESPHFSLEAYHLQGSRILSRSFTITNSRAQRASARPQPSPDTNEESEDEREEVEWDVAVMAPIADMLNAAYERDNARLFDDEEGYDENVESGGRSEGFTMLSTRPIKAGEQIFNTYDSPPNSELLRKYGHVDVFPLEQTQLSLLDPEDVGSWPFGNPGDEVEISGDQIVEAAKGLRSGKGPELSDEDIKLRMEEWLENGQDDSFYASFSTTLDPGMISFARLLLYDVEWEKFKRKGKTPAIEVTEEVAVVVEQAIDGRLARYTSSLRDDLNIITGANDLTPNRKRATIVRIGEKRLLHAARREVRRQLVGVDPRKQKRSNDDDGPPSKRHMV